VARLPAVPTAAGVVALTTAGAATPTKGEAAALTAAADTWARAEQTVAALDELKLVAFADAAVSSRDRPSSAVPSGRWGRRASPARWTWSWAYPHRSTGPVQRTIA
jgi:hypothetical protein